MTGPARRGPTQVLCVKRWKSGRFCAQSPAPTMRGAVHFCIRQSIAGRGPGQPAWISVAKNRGSMLAVSKVGPEVSTEIASCECRLS